MNKINLLFKNSYSGIIMTLPWLETLGISHKLAWQYTKAGWLERIGEKAYKKVNDEISWISGLSAVQYQLQLPIHVGGKTALQLLGRAHFVPLGGIKTIHLFMLPGTKQPKWLSGKVLSGNTFEYYKTSLFGNQFLSLGLIEQEFDGQKVCLSAPERAIMEVLYLVPTKQTFEEAVLLMESLTNLRPDIVQILLEQCNSIKVKRLFLYLAEETNMLWGGEIDLKKIELGKGKRKIGEGGLFNSKYLISVPPRNLIGEHNATLREINLDSNEIGPDGVLEIARALERNTTLREISLDGNNIGSEGAQAIAHALEQNNTLTSIDLEDNNIGNEGVQAIAHALEQNTTLEEINLSNNKFDTSVMREIANTLEKNTTITTIKLSNYQYHNSTFYKVITDIAQRNELLRKLAIEVTPNVLYDNLFQFPRELTQLISSYVTLSPTRSLLTMIMDGSIDSHLDEATISAQQVLINKIKELQENILKRLRELQEVSEQNSQSTSISTGMSSNSANYNDIIRSAVSVSLSSFSSEQSSSTSASTTTVTISSSLSNNETSGTSLSCPCRNSQNSS